MNATQKIMREILLSAIREDDMAHLGPADSITEETVQDKYDQLIELDANWDYESDFRRGVVETGLPAPGSRHYEAKSVAMQCCDGSWVGWTY